MSNLSYQYALKVAAFYNQPLKFGEHDIHPKVEALKNFLDKIDDALQEKFYQKITSSVDHFPIGVDLSNIYQSFNYSKNYVPDYKSNFPMIEDLTIGEEIPKTIDKTAKDALTEYLNDELKLSFKHMLNKYGLKICEQIEGAKGKWSFDNNFEIISADGKERWPDGGWKSEMLFRYLEKTSHEEDVLMKKIMECKL